MKLATMLHDALALSKTPLTNPPPAAAPATPPTIDLDIAMNERELGVKGAINGGGYQLGIPRAEPTTEGGTPVANAMGSAIAINLQPTGAGKAAITGDFCADRERGEPRAAGAARKTASRSPRCITTC